MAFLPGQVGVQKRHPFIALAEPHLLDIAQRGFPLIELRLYLLQRFLSQLEIKARNFSASFQLARLARSLQRLDTHLLTLVAQRLLCLVQLAFGQFDVSVRFRRENRNRYLDAYVDVVALESLVVKI